MQQGLNHRMPNIPGIDHPMVMTYAEAITQKHPVGSKVAVIGAGGIGFDVAVWLTQDDKGSHFKDFCAEWGIDLKVKHRGGLIAKHPKPSPKKVFLLQRKKRKIWPAFGQNNRLDSPNHLAT